jgi:sec-independent protein translocase protein TatB
LLLFIFESIGTAELLLIGVIALIFLGPRKLPEIARKIGKIMTEFRSTTQDFKSTWEREVDFEQEKKAFDIDLLEDERTEEQERALKQQDPSGNTIGVPEIRQIDKASFEKAAAERNSDPAAENTAEPPAEEVDVLSDKRTWL